MRVDVRTMNTRINLSVAFLFVLFPIQKLKEEWVQALGSFGWTSVSYVIGRWYSRQPNHKYRLSTQTIPDVLSPKAYTHSFHSCWSWDLRTLVAVSLCCDPSDVKMASVTLRAGISNCLYLSITEGTNESGTAELMS